MPCVDPAPVSIHFAGVILRSREPCAGSFAENLLENVPKFLPAQRSLTVAVGPAMPSCRQSKLTCSGLLARLNIATVQDPSAL